MLKPVSIVVPQEILFLIAEQCIGPYELFWYTPKYSKKKPLRILPTKSIKPVTVSTTSKDFAAGVRRGLLTSFTGALTVRSADGADDIPKYITKYKLGGLVSKITMINVNGLMLGDYTQIDYSHYANLKKFERSIQLNNLERNMVNPELDKNRFETVALEKAVRVKERFRKAKRTYLTDKLAEGLRMIVVFSYEWHEYDKWETMEATIDISRETPVVLKKETFKDGE